MTMPVANQTPVPSAAPAAPGVPGVPVPQAALAGQSIEALHAQVGDLNVQLAGLRAQWDGLQDQLNSMLKTNPSRPAVVAKWSDVGVQIAQVKGDIARVQAQIAEKQGTPVAGVPVPPDGFRNGPSPDKITDMAFVRLLVVLRPSSMAYARRLWRGKPVPPREPRDDVSGKRLERMEQAIDAIAIEVERISEGQRFVTRLLTEGSAPALSIGQGAAEPVHASEREPARASRGTV
jgi:ribosomal protein L29